MDNPATLTLQNWSVLPLAVLLGLFAPDAIRPSSSTTDPIGPDSGGHETGPVACTKPLPAATDADGGDVSIMLAVVAIAVISAVICRPSTDSQEGGLVQCRPGGRCAEESTQNARMRLAPLTAPAVLRQLIWPKLGQVILRSHQPSQLSELRITGTLHTPRACHGAVNRPTGLAIPPQLNTTLNPRTAGNRRPDHLGTLKFIELCLYDGLDVCREPCVYDGLDVCREPCTGSVIMYVPRVG